MMNEIVLSQLTTIDQRENDSVGYNGLKNIRKIQVQGVMASVCRVKTPNTRIEGSFNHPEHTKALRVLRAQSCIVEK